MKSSTIIGVVLLVMAAGLAATQYILPRMGEVALDATTAPYPVASARIPIGPDVENDWQTLSPRHVFYKRPKQSKHKPVHHKAPAATPRPAADAPTPLPAPTFLPEPKAAPEVIVIHATRAPVITPLSEPVTIRPVPTVKRPVPTPRPTPKGPTAADLARQRALLRSAMIDQAKRTTIGAINSTSPGSSIESLEVDDHGSTISVIVVEQERGTNTKIENFIFTAGAQGGITLTQRRVVSVSQADPYVGSGSR